MLCRSILFGALFGRTLIELLLATVASYTYIHPTRKEEFTLDDTRTRDFGSFDFVIVGGGSAGSVLAARLSEIGDWKILLLEAGEEEPNFADVPAMFPYLQSSYLNWGYYTTVQKNACQGMVNQQCIYPLGKVLGGSSTTNAMMYVRGNRADYDLWEELGNPGWSYEDILPYFKKSENSEILGDLGYHGFDGPLTVSYTNPPLPTTVENFLGANLELGQQTVDYNGAHQIGASLLQCTIRDGKRDSTNRAFLTTARRRGNLRIVTQALVTRVLIDGVSKTARGVLFVNHHKQFRAKATKEVIVSAGAINTPQLLMLSGIGPKRQLEKLSIRVIADLPVGENLKDHPVFVGVAFRTNKVAIADDVLTNVKRFLRGHGFFTSPLGIGGIGFTSAQPNGAPLIEYLYLPQSGQPTFSQDVAKLINANEEVYSQLISKVNPSTDFAMFSVLLHEKSTGSVTLKSSDHLDFPNIDLNFLSDPDGQDIEALYQSVRFIQRLVATGSFRVLNATPLDHGTLCRGNEYDSKEYWYCIIRLLTTNIYHPTGTTRMGPNRSTSVVDCHLKVHGFRKLRVVDAGVFPTTISGHLNAPTIATAEKISDEIKREYGRL